METRKRQRSVSQPKVHPVREGGSAEVLQQAGCESNDTADLMFGVFTVAGFHFGTLEMNCLSFTVRLCPGQGSQGGDENRDAQRHLSAGQDRQPLRPADHLPERQQHKEHLCLPQ